MGAGTVVDAKESVRRQFGAVAAGYATSDVHAGGPDLEAMLAAVALRGDERVLDAGTGAGHAALAFAPRAGEVVAVDLTEPMLEQGRRLAAERRIANVRWEPGDVEHLPFLDAGFDLATSRYSAHHYPHPAAAARELARVLRPGGWLLLADVVAPDDPATDTILNAIEVLRDRSHVRDHTIGQWRALLEAAGFAVELVGSWPLRLRFDAWVSRMRTPPAAVAQIRDLLDGAPAEVRAALRVEDDHTFTVPVALLRGRRLPDAEAPAADPLTPGAA